MFGPPFSPSLARKVAHKPESVPQVVRTRARGFDRHCPHGVAQGFQITSHKSEPCRRARNLLSKADCRRSLGDKSLPFRPQVPLVCEAFALPCRRERLAGTTSCPNRSVVGPACETERETPPADAGEEVALDESGEVFAAHVLDASLVDFAIGNQTFLDELAQPRGGVRVVLVVVRTFSHFSTFRPRLRLSR
jgi:hypothetical protein